MASLGVLGFIFGAYAISRVLTMKKTINELKTKIDELERKIVD